MVLYIVVMWDLTYHILIIHQPLSARRQEHDKVRKSVKETWVKESKKMVSANTTFALHNILSTYKFGQCYWTACFSLMAKHVAM